MKRTPLRNDPSGWSAALATGCRQTARALVRLSGSFSTVLQLPVTRRSALQSLSSPSSTSARARRDRVQIVRAGFGRTTGQSARPELTASIGRSSSPARECPPLPWRVSSSGPVFRYESDTGSARLREFTQVGVELLGAGGPAADAEVIALADQSLSAAASVNATVRIGHVGLILEILAHTGLPPAARSALVEMMSAAAADDGEGIQASRLGAGTIDRLAAFQAARPT